MRLLHPRFCHVLQGLPRFPSQSNPRRDEASARGQSMPLRNLCGRSKRRCPSGNVHERRARLMADYHWPPTDKCSLIGRRISRLDGAWKSSGRIKYSYDVNRPNMLHAKMVFSPYAHAKVVSIDTSAAEKMPGVKAVEIMRSEERRVGKECRSWWGREVVRKK